jgi:hypothetical protein
MRADIMGGAQKKRANLLTNIFASDRRGARGGNALSKTSQFMAGLSYPSARLTLNTFDF